MTGMGDVRGIGCILVPVLEEVLDFRDEQATGVVEFLQWNSDTRRCDPSVRTSAKFQRRRNLLLCMCPVPQTRRHQGGSPTFCLAKASETNKRHTSFYYMFTNILCYISSRKTVQSSCYKPQN